MKCRIQVALYLHANHRNTVVVMLKLICMSLVSVININPNALNFFTTHTRPMRIARKATKNLENLVDFESEVFDHMLDQEGPGYGIEFTLSERTLG